MAVTGVNEYTNTYAASNSASTKGSSGLSETAQNYLSELKQKYSDVNITVTDFSSEKQRKSYSLGCSGYNNVAISSNIIEKMATDPTAAAKYEKVIEKLKEKRLEQAETAEQLLEKLKTNSQAETAEDIAVTATKIPEEGKGTQVDYTI